MNVSFYTLLLLCFFLVYVLPRVPMQQLFGHSGGKIHLTNAFLTHILLWDVQKVDSPNTFCSIPQTKVPKFHRQNGDFPCCKAANCIGIQIIDFSFWGVVTMGMEQCNLCIRMQNAPLNYKYSAWKVLSHFLKACWRAALCWEMAS